MFQNVCHYICMYFVCFFFNSFSCFVLLQFVFFLILFYCCSLDVCLFSNKKKKDGEMCGREDGEEQGKLGEGKNNQNILREKNPFSIKNCFTSTAEQF